MKLLIDPAGGIAGDMFLAALISAGADAKIIKNAILSAAAKLGSAEAEIAITSDGSTQLKIELHSNRNHLSEEEAIIYLNELFSEFRITKKYSRFGTQILNILLNAEKKAHADFKIVIGNHIGIHHQPPQKQGGEILLHEAQDIIIDIIGAVTGIQSLGIEPEAMLLNPVSTGGGVIHFSHGQFPVPAPATKIILDHHKIDWRMGPIQKELCTPTGASILAALKSKFDPEYKKMDLMTYSKGKARGSRIYNIPPLTIYMVKKKNSDTRPIST